MYSLVSDVVLPHVLSQQHVGQAHLLMGHLEHIFASNRDQEVIGRESNLGCQAVFGHLQLMIDYSFTRY